MTTTCARCYEDVISCTCPEPGSEKDRKGRVWRHCEEGLTMTSASMGRFMMFCLRHDVEIGDVHPFNANYRGSQVLASVRLREDQIAAFEAEVKAKLRRPPRIVLN